MKENHIPPMPLSFGLRVEQTLAQIPETERKMNTKKTIAVLAAAVLLLTAAAFAVSGGHIMELFQTKDPGLKEELTAIVQPFTGASYEGEALRVTPGEMMLTEDTLAATWTVENLTDGDLWIDTPADFSLNGDNVHQLGSSTIMSDIGYRLVPGEVRECGIRINLYDDAPEGESCFHMSFTAYTPKEGKDIPLDHTGYVVDKNLESLTLVETVSLTAPVLKSEVATISALPDGEPLEIEFADYTLVVEKAQLSPALLVLKYSRVYSDEAALARTPMADYALTDEAGGSAWWTDGAGRSNDGEAQADGSIVFTWEMEYEINSHPRAIRLVPGYANDAEKSAAETATLEFPPEH